MAPRFEPRYPHLPPGHKPGPQSRNRALDRPIGLVLLALAGVVLVVVGPIGAASGGRQSPAVWLGFFDGLGIAFLVWAWWLWRRTGVPRSSRDFEISAVNLEARRGGGVEVRMTVRNPGGIGERLEVGLVCTEFYDHEVPTGTQTEAARAARQTAAEVAFEEWVPASKTDPVQSFKFEVPAEAPFSHEGECLSFAWRVAAREPRGMRRDPSSDQPIWVLP